MGVALFDFACLKEPPPGSGLFLVVNTPEWFYHKNVREALGVTQKLLH